ncbi:MAG: zinc ribbon domain-containing protein [Candidatus Heimdallarchaeota archaeon]
MSEKKFIICASCGALLEKEVQFCGYCGSKVEEIKEQPPQQPYTQQQPQYGTQSSSYAQYDTWDMSRNAENNVRLAWMFAWFTFLGGIIFLGLTVYYANRAKKAGSTNPRIRQSIIVATIGAVLSFALNAAITYIWLFGFP